MTKLSVNLNKIALLRNSRGHDYPNVVEFAEKALSAGADGITIHPRPDQRHATYSDIESLSRLIQTCPDAELNIEGYPGDDFLEIVLKNKPDQITLVPDAPGQITSDHGWDLTSEKSFVTEVLGEIKRNGVRSSLFLDPVPEQIDLAAETGADRIELYTESYAASFGTDNETEVYNRYRKAAGHAQDVGLGVNAGHDLNLENLGRFISIPAILEVSIGHALTVESLLHGFSNVIKQYLNIINRTVKN